MSHPFISFPPILAPSPICIFLCHLLSLSDFPLLTTEEQLWGNLGDVPFFFFLSVSVLGSDNGK